MKFFPDSYVEETEHIDAVITAAILLKYDVYDLEENEITHQLELSILNEHRSIQLYYKDGIFKGNNLEFYNDLKDEFEVEKEEIVDALKKVITWL